MKVILIVAGRKHIKLCSIESSANAAKSQELRHNDTNAPQPWEIKFNVMFALPLNEEEKAGFFTLPQTVAWFTGLLPPLYLPLSLSLFLSRTRTLQLTDLKTVAFLSELSFSCSLSLPHSPLFPSKCRHSDKELHFAISVLNSLYQFSAFQSMCVPCYVVGEEENLK